ncbi:unnamed protein product [Phytophthora fragariaefolia]|uniref:Unnamed protein product n=1 Tax=Phytophthora fragariaefolia TaxID=1490495 RepID=A0A9W7DB76_9STRA|nr:unnamed protein product [Phytophthora fragariaefolia]
MFLSETFSGAAWPWAIVEKEAYSIIATCQRADYLLHRPGGFTLYTDHRKFQFIFNPTSVLSSVPKYTADKHQRWALLPMAYDYDICDIASDENVWADLLSRWGSSLRKFVPFAQFRTTSTSDDKYILVIKDDVSKYVWFFAVPDATADTTYTCLMDWFAAFGVCLAWVSDQGTHFRNEVIQALQYALGAHHHFTTARCPWANRTVELRVKWCGPAQITKAVSAWIFTVKNLITGDDREVHASRLKVYSDATLNVTKELLHHIVHNSEGHVVAQILDSRYSYAEKRFELLVNSRGLSSAKDSWEPAVTLLEDVPVLVKIFIRANRRTAKTKKLVSGLDLNALVHN